MDLSQHILRNLKISHSQYQQDILALKIFENISEGFFVEFGAADGISGSNSFLLEEFGWKGILSEPARSYWSAIQKNRSALLDKRAVYSKSGESLTFIELGLLSTISDFNGLDEHSNGREKSEIRYEVPTVSLNDLLRDAKCPTQIHYMSIDTEGSEFEILSKFNFSEWKVIFLSIEHNNNIYRERIRELMYANDYSRVLVTVSEVDDWYLLNSFIKDNPFWNQLVG